jgi:succinate dehydrogenase flavin-adding protein (antitoxin of CptAB toxin-antitoxin module)
MIELQLDFELLLEDIKNDTEFQKYKYLDLLIYKYVTKQLLKEQPFYRTFNEKLKIYQYNNELITQYKEILKNLDQEFFNNIEKQSVIPINDKNEIRCDLTKLFSIT